MKAFVLFSSAFAFGPLLLAAAPDFVGSKNCSTSGCHGGAGDLSKQYTVWFRADPHSRGHSTLTTARSARMAEALGMADAARDARCTTCHAPFAAVAPERLAASARIEEGISCESCHGAAEGWWRSHTRKDYSRGQRVAAGMRDLQDLYLRANTCVACHQVIDPELVRAGHPRLHFELESHQEREPRHWKEIWGGPQAWITGQLAVLRELAHRRKTAEDDVVREDWESTLWVLKEILPAAEFARVLPEQPDAVVCDDFARQLAGGKWNDNQTEAVFKRLGQLAGGMASRPAWTAMDAARWRKLAGGLAAVGASMPGAKEERFREALERLRKPLDPGAKGPRVSLADDLKIVAGR
ncbi:MAG: multiheme c-type cytochrome [Candidatus Methylacidiphilales bacterium]|nr:multiheme c-type cytochrome [Candidatus Methylacidiphilales bacterium]